MKNIFLHTKRRLLIALLGIVFPMTIFSQIPSECLTWKFACGGIYSAPLVVGSVIYIGDMNGIFYAIDANYGGEIWRYQAETYIASTATYKDGIVVFEAGDRLHGLDSSTGKLLWSYRSTDKVSTPGYDTGYHHSSPVIEGNTAYYGDEWGYMNGVNIRSGVLDFQYHIAFAYDTLSDYNIRSTPVIKDSVIYFGDYDGRVYAISLKDQSEKWIQKMETPRWDGSVVSEMVIKDDVLYCGRYTNAFIPLKLENGEPLWKFSDWETFLPSTPVFYKDDIIIGTTITSNHIYSINKATGEKHWELKVKGIFFDKPIIIQDSILVMNSTDPFVDHWGALYFVNLEKGEIISQVDLENATESYPILYNGQILMGKGDGLYAFDYKPFLKEPGSSKITFDDSADTIAIASNEALSLSYPIVNTDIFGDTLNTTTEIEGDDSKKYIIYSDKKNLRIRPSQEINFTLKAKKDKLVPGNYSVRITVCSARQSSNPLFVKNILITVKNVSGTTDLGSRQIKCMVSPNPFIDNVRFTFESNQNEKEDLSIFSIEGLTVYSKTVSGGVIEWDGCDSKGHQLPSGLCIFKPSSEKKVLLGKLMKK